MIGFTVRPPLRKVVLTSPSASDWRRFAVRFSVPQSKVWLAVRLEVSSRSGSVGSVDWSRTNSDDEAKSTLPESCVRSVGCHEALPLIVRWFAPSSRQNCRQASPAGG